MEQFDDYRTDSTYVETYIPYVSPALMRLSLLFSGVEAPQPEPGVPFRYLELGIGFGASLAMHAAANAGEYWGVDFMEAHCQRAKTLFAAAGLESRILCKSFADVDAMSAAGELPQFDMIAMHGIWSWINADNRRHIRNIIERNLRPGGVVYNSYNTLPGWSYFQPVRELMLSMALRYGEEGKLQELIPKVIAEISTLARSGATFFNGTPRSVEHLREIADKDVRYLAQEYFNTTWRPFYFREVAEDFAEIGCAYAAPGDFLDRVEGMFVPDAETIAAKMINPILRETVHDFVVDRQFRKDLFVKNPRRLSGGEQRERLGECAFRLVFARNNIPAEVKQRGATITLHPQVFGPLFDALAAEGGRPKKVKEFAEPLFSSVERRKELLRYLSILVGRQIIIPVFDDPAPGAGGAAKRLNKVMVTETVENSSAIFLVSPVCGYGLSINLSREEKLFLSCRDDAGANDAASWAGRVVDRFQEQGMTNPRDEALGMVTGALTHFIQSKSLLMEALGMV